MRVKKQLCCGSFFNDPKSTCMNLLVVACLFDMGEGTGWGGGESFPLWVLTDIWTGRSCCKTEGRQMRIQVSDTRVQLFMDTCKGKRRISGPDLMFV